MPGCAAPVDRGTRRGVRPHQLHRPRIERAQAADHRDRHREERQVGRDDHDGDDVRPEGEHDHRGERDDRDVWLAMTYGTKARSSNSSGRTPWRGRARAPSRGRTRSGPSARCRARPRRASGRATRRGRRAATARLGVAGCSRRGAASGRSRTASGTAGSRGSGCRAGAGSAPRRPAEELQALPEDEDAVRSRATRTAARRRAAPTAGSERRARLPVGRSRSPRASRSTAWSAISRPGR